MMDDYWFFCQQYSCSFSSSLLRGQFLLLFKNWRERRIFSPRKKKTLQWASMCDNDDNVFFFVCIHVCSLIFQQTYTASMWRNSFVFFSFFFFSFLATLMSRINYKIKNLFSTWLHGKQFSLFSSLSGFPLLGFFSFVLFARALSLMFSVSQWQKTFLLFLSVVIYAFVKSREGRGYQRDRLRQAFLVRTHTSTI